MPRIAVDKDSLGLQAEHRLLLWCARTHINTGLATRVCHLIEHTTIDWEETLRCAEQHRLRPLLFWHLNQICPALVPLPILEQLQSSFQSYSWRSLLLTEECLRILRLFEQHGIAAVPLKGPVLAHTLYGNPALRVFEDLDILIHEQHRLQAMAVLYDIGFTPWEEGKTDYHSGFISPDRSWPLELHWGLTIPALSELSAANMLRRAQMSTFAGISIRQLDPIDLLIFLCLHGAKHHWCQLRWIVDIAEYLRTYAGIDWECVMSAATSTGHERVILLGLHLAHQLLEAPLPDNVVQKIAATPIIREMAQHIQADLFQDASSLRVRVAPNGVDIQSLDSTTARMRLVLQQLIKDLQPKRVDYQLIRLPEPLGFLYYPLRLLRLMLVYRTLMLKRVVRNIRSIW
jgi:hypothetical protein